MQRAVFDITIAAGNANGTGVKKISLAVTDFGKWPYSMDFTSKSLEPSSENLAIHWKLDETSGTTAADLSGAETPSQWNIYWRTSRQSGR